MSNRRFVSSSSKRAAALALCIGTGLAPCAYAQESTPTEPPPSAPPSDEPTFEPPVPPESPTPPEVSTPPGTVPAPSVDTVEAPADGQWVYTNQYGWVFMPYAQNYTYVPENGYPFMFVYGPGWGWRWLSAPWVFGIGPAPYWGPRGYAYFAWHARPWFAHRTVVHGAPAVHHWAGGGHGFAHGHGHRR